MTTGLLFWGHDDLWASSVDLPEKHHRTPDGYSAVCSLDGAINMGLHYFLHPVYKFNLSSKFNSILEKQILPAQCFSCQHITSFLTAGEAGESHHCSLDTGVHILPLLFSFKIIDYTCMDPASNSRNESNGSIESNKSAYQQEVDWW